MGTRSRRTAGSWGSSWSRRGRNGTRYRLGDRTGLLQRRGDGFGLTAAPYDLHLVSVRGSRNLSHPQVAVTGLALFPLPRRTSIWISSFAASIAAESSAFVVTASVDGGDHIFRSRPAFSAVSSRVTVGSRARPFTRRPSLRSGASRSIGNSISNSSVSFPRSTTTLDFGGLLHRACAALARSSTASRRS